MSVKHAMLALLSAQPSSTYQLRKRFDASTGRSPQHCSDWNEMVWLFATTAPPATLRDNHGASPRRVTKNLQAGGPAPSSLISVDATNSS